MHHHHHPDLASSLWLEGSGGGLYCSDFGQLSFFCPSQNPQDIYLKSISEKALNFNSERLLLIANHHPSALVYCAFQTFACKEKINKKLAKQQLVSQNEVSRVTLISMRHCVSNTKSLTGHIVTCLVVMWSGVPCSNAAVRLL